MGNIVINGTIITVGPLSIAMPNDERTPEYGGFPMMARGVDEDGNKLKTGYLPATTVRGFLRRAVVTAQMRTAAEDGAPFNLKRAYSELIGQDEESEKQAGEIDLLEIKKTRDSSPVLDLFGSGLGIASRLRVGHFLPKDNVLPDRYTAPRKDLGDGEGVLSLLSEAAAEEYVEREDSNRRRVQAEALCTDLKRKIAAAKRKDEDHTELETQLKEAEKTLQKYQKEMGGMQVSSRAIFDLFALPANLDLVGRIVICNAKARDLEMIEFGLDCLSQNPVLGAQSARGCGEIKGSFEVLEAGTLKKKITLGDYNASQVDVF
jgi:hypothetical protein